MNFKYNGKLTRLSALAVAALGVTALTSGVAQAQDDWPTDSVTIVVAYPAGGGTDSAIRAMVNIVSEELGQSVLVQNVGGAGGGVAATQVAAKEPDGYTILATNSTSITLAPLVQETVYSIDSFDHVAILADFQNAVFTGPESPYNTLDELVALAEEEERPITYASQLAIDRLLMQYVAQERGFELRPVPVDGGSGAVKAVLSGDVDMAFSGGSWAPIVEAGDAKSLFAASYDRLKVAPKLVSMSDLGFPFGVTSRISLHTPAGTPEDVLQKLSDAFKIAASSDRAQQIGERRSMDMTFRGHEDAVEAMQTERETYETILENLDSELF